MDPRQTLPNLWLLSDERNDAVLEEALAKLPAGSGFVFRHYHLSAEARRERFTELSLLSRISGHLVILADNADTALKWGAEGVYGAVGKLGESDCLLRLATVHDLAEMRSAEAEGADATFLSPVFPTRSHSDGQWLGKEKFLALAATATRPVIALGGMNPSKAEYLGWPRWGAIDGLS